LTFPNREELAYAGGLFEGEGYFTMVTKHPGHPAPHAGIEMTDREPLERFARAVGFGTVHGPGINRGPDGLLKKPRYTWKVGTLEKTQALTAMLWPWLGPRRRARAAEVLRADGTRSTGSTNAWRWFGKRYRDLDDLERAEYFHRSKGRPPR
jgi:hypothetical protein